MHATNDRHWRMVSIWQQGLIDRLPQDIMDGIITYSKDEEGYALLMHNLSHTLLPDDQLLTAQENVFFLDRLAAFHATYWEDDLLQNPQGDLCSLEDFLSDTSITTIERVAAVVHTYIIEFILKGRRLLSQFLEPDFAELIDALSKDPAPLCTALDHYPKTLVHNDFRRPNLAIEPGD